MKKTSIIIMISLITIILITLNFANSSIATGEETTEDIIATLSVKTTKLSKTTYTYNGELQKPEVIVKNNEGTTLENNTDYEITY